MKKASRKRATKKAAKKKTAKKKPAKKKTGKAVHIRIKSGALTVTPEFVPIKTKKKEEVVWRGHGGRIQISFDKGQGTPFRSGTFQAADETDRHSGQAIVQPVPKQRFNYSVRLTKPDGTVLELDPGVDVDGSGPPNGGRRKAAKKKATRKRAGKKAAARKRK